MADAQQTGPDPVDNSAQDSVLHNDQQSQDQPLLPQATPTFTAPASAPVQDAGWASFVDQHANKNTQPDEEWNSLVKSQPDQEPSWQSQAYSDVKELPHVANAIIGGLGSEINSTVSDMFKSFTTLPSFSGLEKGTQTSDAVSKDLDQFRSSTSYKEASDNFVKMVGDVIKPSADAFFKSAYYRQVSLAFDQLNSVTENFSRDEFGSPLDTLTPEDFVQKTMTYIASDVILATSLSGVSGAAQQIATPIGQKLFPNNPDAAQAYAEGIGQGMINLMMMGKFPLTMMGKFPDNKPPIIARSESTGVFKGEDAYFNEPLIKETAPQTEAEPETAAPSAEPIVEKPETTTAPKIQTVDDIARQNEPVLFKQYDDINSRQERLRGWIDDLSDIRDQKPEIAETQSKIDAILSKVNGVEDRLTNKQAAMLDDLRGKLDDIKTSDTPDMATIRKQLVDLEHQKFDMAEQVSAAYREAREQMPEQARPETVENTRQPEKAAQPDVVSQPVESKINPSGKAPEALTVKGYVDDYMAGKGRGNPEYEQFAANNADAIEKEFQSRKETPPLDIAGDISKNLTAIGRPAEEAQAGGQVAARMYQYFADTYGGAKGTAEDWYNRESPRIALKGEKAKALAQNKLGQITLATKAARAVLKMSKSANASTFVHEMAHHFLEMMDRFGKEDEAPEQLKKDLQTIRDWSGLPKNEAKTQGEKAAYTRAQEKFARGFERYLMEGVAPSKDLADVFGKFKKWLTDIYQTVKDIPNQKGGINDNIRNFFDRVMTRNPDKTIIASEHPEGAEFAGLHEADAEHTAPEHAEAVADNIYNERQKLEEKNGISTGQNAEGPTGGAEPSETGNGSEPASTAEGTPGQPTEVGAGGDQAAAEGAGLRSAEEPANATATAERGNAPGAAAGEPSGNAAARADEGSAGYTAGERTNGAARPAGAESYYVDKAGRFRLDKFNTSHDAMAMLTEMVAKNADFMDARSGTNAYKQAKLIEANFQLIEQLAEEGSKLEKDFEKNPEEAVKYLRISEQLRIAATIRAELQSDWGHAGHALRRVSQATLDNIEKVTGKTLYQLTEEAKLMDQVGDPKAKADFAKDMRDGKWRRFEDATLGYFRNAILSNPKTHAMYLAGNLFWAETRAIATLGSAASIGAIREALGGKVNDRVYFSEIPRAVAAIHSGALNAMPVAAAALRSGVPFMRGAVAPLAANALKEIFAKLPEKGADYPEKLSTLDAARKEAVEKGVKESDIKPHLALMNADGKEAADQKSNYPAIHAYLEEATAGGNKEYTQSVPGKLGRALTVPERSLAAIHTISYALNFEMEIASKATRSGLDKGLEGDDLDLHIAKYTQNPPVDVMQSAHDASLKAVFMNRPEYGSMQQRIASALHSDAPGLRLLTGVAVPFAQIGMNIIDQGFIEGTPLGFLKQSVRDDFKAGGAKRDMAAARMIVGSGMGLAAAALNSTGFMTGGGPADYRKKAVLEATGWKAYSLKIGDLYIPYKKWLGPMGPLMGACADLQEVGHLLSVDDRTNAAKGIAAAFGENVADETWMNGLSNLVQAFQSLGGTGDKMWKFIENTAASFVPYSAAMNEVARQTDPTKHDLRSDGVENLWGLLPTVANKIPGLSYMLPAKVDVFGNPMPSSTGAGISMMTNDPLAMKLSEIGVGISQPGQSIRGIRLNNDQYHDYAITAGVLVRQNLEGIINDPNFDQMPTGAKVKEISSIVRQSRHAAQQDVLFRNQDIVDKANAKKEKAEEE